MIRRLCGSPPGTILQQTSLKMIEESFKMVYNLSVCRQMRGSETGEQGRQVTADDTQFLKTVFMSAAPFIKMKFIRIHGTGTGIFS
jgi:hypothetical protein